MKFQLCQFIYIDTSKLIFRTRNNSWNDYYMIKQMYYLHISAFCNNNLLCNYYVLSLILFLFEVNKQQSLVLLNDKTTLTAFQKFFRESSRSQGYVTYIAFASNRTPMWLDLMIMKEFLTTNSMRNLLGCYNLIRVFLNKIQCLLLATLTYYRGTLCIVYLYQFSLLLDVNYNLLTNTTLYLFIKDVSHFYESFH